MRESKKQWYIHFFALKRFIEEKKRFPFYSEVYENFDLGRWCSIQTGHRKNGNLDETQLKCLHSIEFPDRILRYAELVEIEWKTNIELLIEYFEKFNDLPKEDVVYKDVQLGIWWKKIYIKHRAKVLSQEKSEFIKENILCKKEKRWDRTYRKLEEYIMKNGHYPDSTVKDLYRWMVREKSKYKNGELSEYNVRKLQELGLLYVDEHWNEYYGILKKYIENYNCYPNKEYDLELYNWTIIQAERFKSKHLTAKEYRRLKAIKMDIYCVAGEEQ